MKNAILLVRIFALLLPILLFTSCNQKENPLKTYFKEKNIGEINSYRAIINISDRGECITCNNKVSKEFSRFLDSNDLLFIITSHGQAVDISYYYEKEGNSNLIFDQVKEFDKLNLLSNCGVIFLENNEIDSCVDITIPTFDQDWKFFHEKMKYNQN